jgi:hypothetical protein
MTEKPSPQLRITPMQRVKAVPVTDPAELAALDEMRRRMRTVTAGLTRLYLQLPEAERSPLIARLASELTDDAQLELVAELAAKLPAAILPALEEELQTRLDPSAP